MVSNTKLVFVDSALSNYQYFLENVSEDTEIILLDSTQDGVQQITAALSKYTDLSSIQIFSHGSDGQLQLGNTLLNGENLEAYKAQLAQWGKALAQDADLLLFGCNVAGSKAGEAFIQHLSEMTGADVAASDDVTGIAGDWQLEIETGLINAPLAFQIAVLEAYTSNLGIYTVTNLNNSGAGSLRQAILEAASTPGLDLIDLTKISGTITLNSSLPTISSGNDLFIVGNNNVVIDGQDLYQIIAVDGGTVGFEGIKFEDGYAKGGDAGGGGGGGLGAGGAIFINRGNVTVRNVTFDSNSAKGGDSFGTAGAGGGDEQSGSQGGYGGRFNDNASFSTNGAAPGSGGAVEKSGSAGTNGEFGAGGGAGGGGGGGDDYGHGGVGGQGGFGAGGGGGGGGGNDYDTWIDGAGEDGSGGAGGGGGTFGGSGQAGATPVYNGGDTGSYPGGIGGGGAGLGGAIFVKEGATLAVFDSRFTNNSVIAGRGGNSSSTTDDGQAFGQSIVAPYTDSNTSNTVYGNGWTDGYFSGYKFADTASRKDSVNEANKLPTIAITPVSASEITGTAEFKLEVTSGSLPTDGIDVYYYVSNTNNATRAIDLTTGGTVSVSSTNSPAGEDGSKAFDNNLDTKWLLFSQTGWIQYKLAANSSSVVTSYAITSASDVPGRDPKSWKLQGSNDGTNFVDLDTRSNLTFSDRGQTQLFSIIGNQTAYQYYRLNVTANNGDSYLQIADLQLFESGDFINDGIQKVRLKKNSQTFTVPVIDDDEYEQNTESLNLRLLQSSNYKLATSSIASQNIVDDETRIGINPLKNAVEGNVNSPQRQNGEFELVFDRPAAVDFTLKLEPIQFYSRTSNPAPNVTQGPVRGTIADPHPDSDYKLYWRYRNEPNTKNYLLQNGNDVNEIRVTAGTGQGDRTIVIGVEMVDNDIFERQETLSLKLKDGGTGDNYVLNNAQIQTSIAIQDDEPIISVSKVVNPTEGFGYGSTLVGLGKALELKDGQKIETSNASITDLSKSNAFTQELWVSVKNLSTVGVGGYRLFGFSNNGPTLKLNQNGTITASFTSNGQQISLTSTQSIREALWTHLAVTFDGDKFKLFINAQENIVIQQKGLQVPFNPAGTLAIGSSDSSQFSALVDEVRLWNTARTQGEIQRNLIQTLKGDEPGLSGYWQFEDKFKQAYPNSSLIENPAPQIGYIELQVTNAQGNPSPVQLSQGLWVRHNITGGTAKQKLDYYNSQFQITTTNDATRYDGVVIPKGESTARIYFGAIGDAIDEGDETIQLEIIPYNVDKDPNNTNSTTTKDPITSKYGLKDSNGNYVDKLTQTVTLKDNQSYKAGIVLLDQDGRPITDKNPLVVRSDGTATLQVRLTSEPDVDAVNFNLSVNRGQLTQASITAGRSFLAPQAVLPQGLANLDVGSDSSPVFVDIDNDGDLDLFVGGSIDTSSSNPANEDSAFYDDLGKIQFWRNIGNKQAPNYQKQDASNPLSFVTLNYDSVSPPYYLESPSPNFGDVDGDGDFDVIVGNYPGTINYYQNTGTQTTPNFVERTSSLNPFNSIQIEKTLSKFGYSKPFLVDIDKDGDLDLFVGGDNGKINYYQNIGTKTSPNFVERTGQSNPLSYINVQDDSAPAFLDADEDGDFDAFVGSDAGTIQYHENIGTAQSSVFIERIDSRNPFRNQEDTSPIFADINNDGNIDSLIGKKDGKLLYFQGGADWETSLAVKVTGLQLNNTTDTIQLTFNTLTSDPKYKSLNGKTLTVPLGKPRPDFIEVAESNRTQDQLPVIPEVSIAAGNIAIETSPLPGTFAVRLSDPAPKGGLTIPFQISGGTAKFESDLTTGGTVNVSSSNSPANEDSSKAFDNDINTKWLLFSQTGWIQYKLAANSSSVVSGYAITSGNDFSGRDPKSWKLQGSNDGTNFVDLDTRSNVTFSSRKQTQYFNINNQSAYQYYRLDVTANNGDSYLQIADIQLFEYDYKVEIADALSGVGVRQQNNTYTITIPEGENTAQIRIRPLDDNRYEGSETIQATLTPPSNNSTYTLNSQQATATLNLKDNNNPSIELSEVSYTKTSRNLTLSTSNPLANLDRQGQPVFADLDRDKDLDLLIVANDGQVYFYQHDVAKNGDSLTHSFIRNDAKNPFTTINVGVGSQLILSDFDSDGKGLILKPGTTNENILVQGDLDAIVIKTDGNIDYYKNTDSSSLKDTPSFVKETSDRAFSTLNLGQNSQVTLVDFDFDRDADLFVINANGSVSFYENVDLTQDRSQPNYQQRDRHPFSGITLVPNSNLAFTDLDKDGDLDAYSIKDGTVAFYENRALGTEASFELQTDAKLLSNIANLASGSKLNFVNLNQNALGSDYEIDAVIQKPDGSLSYYENGTQLTPFYSPGFTRVIIDENGTQVSFGIRLTSKPSSDVTLKIEGVRNRTNEVKFDKTTLTFTSDNWDRHQLVTATGVDDAKFDGKVGFTAVITSASNDPNYKLDNIYLPVTILDNEESPSTPTVKPGDNTLPQISLNVLSQAQESGSLGQAEVKLSKPLEVPIEILQPINGTSEIVIPIRLNTTSQNQAQSLPLLKGSILKFGNNIKAEVLKSTALTNKLEGNSVLVRLTEGTTVAGNTTGTALPVVQVNLLVGGDAIAKQDYQGFIQDYFDFETTEGTNNLTSIINQNYFRHAVGDLNSDGDLDIVAGNVDGLLTIIENTGTATTPNFVLRDKFDAGNILAGINGEVANNKSLHFSSPVLVDIDRDNDLDVFVGFNNNKLHFYKNDSIGSNRQFTKVTTNNPFSNLANLLGLNNTSVKINPTFADLDRDRDSDLVIGAGDRLYYLQNTTVDVNNLQFTLLNNDDINNPLARIGGLYQPIPSFVDLDSDGDSDLVVKNANSSLIRYFANIGGSGNPVFEEVSQTNSPFGFRDFVRPDLTPAFGDFNNDGSPDLFLGEVGNSYQILDNKYQPIIIAPGETNTSINITAIDDKFAQGDRKVSLQITAGEHYYLGNSETTVPNKLTGEVIVKDNDVAGVIIRNSQGTVITSNNSPVPIEEGRSATQPYSVVLSSQPQGVVEVYLTSNNEREGLVQTGSKSPEKGIKLTFNAINWNQPQYFSVNSPEDNIDDGNVEFKIVTKVVSSDRNYNDFKAVNLNLTSLDNDVPSLIVNTNLGARANLIEGVTDGYAIKLSHQPDDSIKAVKVRVNALNDQLQLNGLDAGEPVELKFTAQNWQQEQTVRVNAVDDDIVEGTQYTNLVLDVEREIEFAEFDNSTALKLQGTTAKTNFLNATAIQLTDKLGDVGGLFYKDAVVSLSPKHNFSTSFRFQMNDPYKITEGMAFIIAATPGLGTGGSGLGYQGLNKSVVIELDPTASGGNDLTSQHLALHINGNSQAESYKLLPATLTDTYGKLLDKRLNNGQEWTAWVDYDGTSDRLEVRLSDTLSRPALADLTYKGVRNVIGGNTAYLGFSGANSSLDFVPVTSNLPSVVEGAADWADYDVDGDLDLLLTGNSNGNSTTHLYRNEDDGTLVEVKPNLPGIEAGFVKWVDYDGDADADLFLTGGTNQNQLTKIYRNENGNLVDINTTALSVNYPAADWGDYDRDGDLDLLLTGQNVKNGSGTIITKLYQNDRGNFIDRNISNLQNVAYGAVSWIDYDGDADLDILLTGATNFSFSSVTKVYSNNGDRTFTEVASPFPNLPGLYDSAIAWGDYDNDGNLDLAISGNSGNSSNPVRLSRIYHNNGKGSFQQINSSLVGVDNGSLAWGDYDKDGDLDLALSGGTGSSVVTKIYINQGNNTFVDSQDNLPGVVNGSIQWVDYDEDGYLDLFTAGSIIGQSTQNTAIYHNNTPNGAQQRLVNWNIQGNDPSYTEVKFDNNTLVKPLTQPTFEVEILDNDLPTASLITGPKALEVSSPSYFTVQLDNVTSDGIGNTGLKVNYRVVGGSAKNGRDYQTIATKDFLRIAPGQIQQNLLVFPIDDFVSESTEFTITQYNAQTGQVGLKLADKARIYDGTVLTFGKDDSPEGTVARVKLDTASANVRIDPKNNLAYVEISSSSAATVPIEYLSGSTNLTTNATTGVKAAPLKVTNVTSNNNLPTSVNLQIADKFTVGAGSVLNLDGGLKLTVTQEIGVTPSGVTVPVTLSNESLAELVRTGSIASLDAENITVELLPGEGYKVNADPTKNKATLEIVDNDKPGFRISTVGDRAVVKEGETTEYSISLLSEPQSSVTINLYNDEQIKILNLSQQLLDADLKNLSGDRNTGTLHLRLFKQPTAPVVVEVSFKDQNADGTEVKNTRQLTFNPTDWDRYQTVENVYLTPDSQGDKRFKAKVKHLDNTSGAPTDIDLYFQQVSEDRFDHVPNIPNTSFHQLTFDASNWYKLQPVSIQGVDEAKIEETIHDGLIKYSVTTGDPNYAALTIADQSIGVVDRAVDAKAVNEGFSEAGSTIGNIVNSIEFPMLGKLEDLGFDIVDDTNLGDLLDKIASALSKAKEGTAEEIKNLLDESTGGLGANINLVMDGDDTRIDIEGYFSWRGDLRVPQSWGGFNGESFNLLGAQGGLFLEAQFLVGLSIGANPDFGVYIDTKRTGIAASLTAGLTEDFKARALMFDVLNDTKNPTSAEIKFAVKLNDLDNGSLDITKKISNAVASEIGGEVVEEGAVQFFDVNSDGRLNANSFNQNVFVDNNKDSVPDIKIKDGKPVPDTIVKPIQEPFSIVKAGTEPLEQNISNSTNQNITNLDWNNNQKLDEAVFQKKEGLYRLKTETSNTQTPNPTQVYFDVNRNGKYDEGELITDNATWFDKTTNQLKKPFEILVKPKANNQNQANNKIQEFYFDANGNQKFDSQEDRLITDKSKKELDRNNNDILDTDVELVGEGQIVKGIGLGYADLNNDERLTINPSDSTNSEPYTHADFDSLEVEESRLAYFLDLNSDGRQTAQRTAAGANELGDLTLIQRSIPNKSDESFWFLDIDRDGGYTDNSKLLIEPKIQETEEGLFFLDLPGMTVAQDGTITYSAPDGNLNTTAAEIKYYSNFLDIDGDYTQDGSIVEPLINFGKPTLSFLDLNNDGKQQKLLDYNRNGIQDGNDKEITSLIRQQEQSNDKSFFYLDENDDSNFNYEEYVLIEGTNYYLDRNNNSKVDGSDYKIEFIANRSQLKSIESKEETTYYLDLNNNNTKDNQETILEVNNRLFRDLNQNDVVDRGDTLISTSDRIQTDSNNKKYLDETGDRMLTREFKAIKTSIGYVLDLDDDGLFDKDLEPLIVYKEGNIQETTELFNDALSPTSYIDYDNDGTYNNKNNSFVLNILKPVKELKVRKYDDSSYYIDTNSDKSYTAGEPIGKKVSYIDVETNTQFDDSSDWQIREKTTTGSNGNTFTQYRFNDANNDGVHDPTEPIVINRVGYLDTNNDSKFTLPGGEGVVNLNLEGLSEYIPSLAKKFPNVANTTAAKNSPEATILTNGWGTRFLDLLANGEQDPGEPFADSDSDPLTIPQEAIVTYRIIKDTTTGNLYLDNNRDGKANSILLGVTDQNLSQNISFAGLWSSAPQKKLFELIGLDDKEIDDKLTKELTFLDLNGNGKIDVVKPITSVVENKNYPQIEPLIVTRNINGNIYRFADINGDGQLNIDSARDVNADDRFSFSEFDLKLEPSAKATTDFSGLKPKRFNINNDSGWYLDLNNSGAYEVGLDYKYTDATKVASGEESAKEYVDDGDRLTLGELATHYKGSSANKLKDLFTLDISGEAQVGLTLGASLTNALPSIAADVLFKPPVFNYNTDTSDAFLTRNNFQGGYTLEINNVGVDLGPWASGVVNDVMVWLDNTLIEPVRPIIDFFNADVELPAKLGVDGTFEKDGKPGTTPLELLEGLADIFLASQDKNNNSQTSTTSNQEDPWYISLAKGIRTTSKVVRWVVSLSETIEKFAQLDPNKPVVIDFGSFDIAANFGSKDPQDDITNVPLTNSGNSSSTNLSTSIANTNLNQSGNSNSGQVQQNQATQTSPAASSFLSTVKDGIKFPIITNPLSLLGLILGQPVDMIAVDVPAVNIGASLEVPIWGYKTTILGKEVGASIGIKGGVDLSLFQHPVDFGFDTYGIQQAYRNGINGIADLGKIFSDGLYITDASEGSDLDELLVNLKLALVGGIQAFGLLDLSLEGGLLGKVGIDLVDDGELDGTSDGKLRLTEIINRFVDGFDSNNPSASLSSALLSIFQISGEVSVYAKAVIDSFLGTLLEVDIDPITLLSFSAGGGQKASIGTFTQSYIIGGTVFFDANSDNIVDPNEPTAITNIDGSFELDIPYELFDKNANGILDPTEGRLVAFGGIDSTSGLPITTPMYAIPESKITSPVTTLKASLVAQRREVSAENLETLIKQGLGLPTQVDIDTFDPIRAMTTGDGNARIVYQAHVQLQGLIAQSLGFVEGIIITALNTSIVTKVIDTIASKIAEYPKNSQIFDFANPTHAKDIFDALKLHFAQNITLDASVINTAVSKAVDELTQTQQQVKDTFVQNQNSTTEELLAQVAQRKEEVQILAPARSAQFSEDRAPEVDRAIADVTVNEDAANTTININDLFTDIDNDVTLISKTISGNSNPNLVSANLDGNNLTLDYLDNQSGTAQISVTGTSNGKVAVDTFSVTVNPVDDLPTIKQAIADVTVNEDAANTKINLSNLFTDIDNDVTLISKTISGNSNPNLVSANLDGNNLTLDYLENQSGTAEITIQGSSNGRTVEDTFAVTVNSVNDAPTLINSISDTTTRAANSFNFVLAANTFSDIDGDTLSYNATSSNGSNLPAWLNFDPDTLTFSGTPTSSDVGTLNIRVSASDREFSSGDDFKLTITDNKIDGTPGNDFLYGTALNDTLNGNSGNDELTGFAGADILNGGDGIDVARYDASNAGVTIDLTTDTASGGHAQGDDLNTIENVMGSPYNDTLTGDIATNSLLGLAGNDILSGLANDDSLYGDEGNDTLSGGLGRDFLRGSTGSDILNGNEDNDRLYGDEGNDRLFGGDGRDMLYGGDGDDLLDGGAAGDRLYGNAGADTFVLRAGDNNDNFVDAIYNFTKGTDKLGLANGLQYNQLNFTPNGSGTAIGFGSEQLAVLNTFTTGLDANDFVNV